MFRAGGQRFRLRFPNASLKATHFQKMDASYFWLSTQARNLERLGFKSIKLESSRQNFTLVVTRSKNPETSEGTLDCEPGIVM